MELTHRRRPSPGPEVLSSGFAQRVGPDEGGKLGVAHEVRGADPAQSAGLALPLDVAKRDDDRVDIAKLDEDDLEGDSVTGGYILRMDWLENPQGFQSNYNSQGGIPMFYQWYYPKANKIKPQQAAYIEEWMDEFEEALYSNDFTNNTGNRYTDYIDLNSFTDFLLITSRS